MIKLSQIKIKIEELDKKSEEEQLNILKRIVIDMLKISKNQLLECKITKKSIDARKKNEIKFVYTVTALVENEDKLVKKLKNKNISLEKQETYEFIPTGHQKLQHRPIIVGTGPAGLFCALLLAEQGFCPIVLERGADVDKRTSQVSAYWKGESLNLNSNVQFGEGGAGTFSDGKLNTMVKDVSKRSSKVFEVFVEHGAPSEILYLNKPHIGTDQLIHVVKNMRNRIISLGGEVRFETQFTDFTIENGKITKIQINNNEWIECEILVLATGHSARDTFQLLYHKGIEMIQKPFAIGVRIEHPQELINKAQYGSYYDALPAADYKLTFQATNKRSVFSFCMCPGGFVVNSSSEEGHLVVNGMSNYKRDEKNANSAIIVSISPSDFSGDNPLSGIEFQRNWEKLAYQTGEGRIPIQLLGDFYQNRISTGIGGIMPNIKGETKLADLNNCLPPYVTEALKEGILDFNRKIPGFSNDEAVISGVETRTSSPVRMIRSESLESNYKGIYPCGEGAGYAGGITSAAMDGIKVYEAIAETFIPAD